jgi:hypothetical protein
MIYSYLSRPAAAGRAWINKAYEICGLGIRVNQPAFGCEGNRFGTANRFQLCQDRSDVTLYRSFADIKNRPYLLVASAVGDTPQNFKLTLREFGMCNRRTNLHENPIQYAFLYLSCSIRLGERNP